MSSAEVKAMTVEVSKEISAPIDRVFKAWTDPVEMKQWYNMTTPGEIQIKQNLRVGGEFEFVKEKGCGEMPVRVFGVYKEIVPNKKLVYTWTNESQDHAAKDTVVTVEFVDKGKSTLVKVRHTNFASQNAFEAHNKGWNEVLRRIAEAVNS